MFNLSPKNDKFFDMFISFSEITTQAAEKFKIFAEDPSDSEEKFQQIKNLEHDGDEKLHEMFKELNNSFITPIDREDIYAIGKALDDILDFIEATASRFVMFNITKPQPHAVTFADLVLQSCIEITGLMKELKHMKKTQEIMRKIVEINRLENVGDVTFRKAIREMFDNPPSTLEVIVWKEIYECLEDTVDACEDVANIIEGVVMKHA
jgi:hypothetical protein